MLNPYIFFDYFLSEETVTLSVLQHRMSQYQKEVEKPFLIKCVIFVIIICNNMVSSAICKKKTCMHGRIFQRRSKLLLASRIEYFFQFIYILFWGKLCDIIVFF
jgi:hypothetical protein